jgi:hypothetical protein
MSFSIAALVLGIPLWFGWEYARPTWTTGVITGTEVRRSDPRRRASQTSAVEDPLPWVHYNSES